MNFEGWKLWLQMGGYGWYVWPSFGLVAFAIVGEQWQLARRWWQVQS